MENATNTFADLIHQLDGYDAYIANQIMSTANTNKQHVNAKQLLRVFIDKKSPMNMGGDDGELRWYFANVSESALYSLELQATPTNPNFKVHDKTSNALIPASMNFGVFQSVDLSAGRTGKTGRFTFSLTVKIQTESGTYQLNSSMPIEFTKIPFSQDDVATEIEVKGGAGVIVRGGSNVKFSSQGDGNAIVEAKKGSKISADGAGSYIFDLNKLEQQDDHAEQNVNSSAPSDLTEITNFVAHEIVESSYASAQNQAPEHALFKSTPIFTPPSQPDAETSPQKPQTASATSAISVIQGIPTHFFTQQSIVFGRWDEAGNDKADAWFKVDANQNRISAKHFVIHKSQSQTQAQFKLEDTSSLGTLVNGNLPSKNQHITLVEGMQIELTRSLPGIVYLTVMCVAPHALILAELKNKPENQQTVAQEAIKNLYIVLQPNCHPQEKPDSWPSFLPMVWHEQGHFKPNNLFKEHP